MKRDIDELISDTDKEIEKLKILKAKQEEMKQLQAELGIGAEKLPEVKPKKEKKHKIPKLVVTPRSRKVIASVIVFCMISMAAVVFMNRVEAANPTVVYTSPADSGLFADTNDGGGVSWVINVSDADTDIAEVELWSNSSGSWAVFYDSGALGGVAYHNTSGQNGNWTGSWTKYWWNISANDGAWTNVTYSFTTGYQWGDPQMAVLDDVKTFAHSVSYKNSTSDYLLFCAGDGIDVKTSDTGTNWSLESKGDIAAGSYSYSGFTYDNLARLYYFSTNLRVATLAGASWSTASTGCPQYVNNVGGNVYSYGADAKYFNGKWTIVLGYATYSGSTNYAYLRWMYGTSPLSSFTHGGYLESASVGGYGHITRTYYPALATLNGVLHCIYRDSGEDLHWYTYDGASWTDKGDIEANIGDGCSLVKDPVNDRLVCVYIDGSGDLKYRTTDNTTSWSASQPILSAGGYTIQYPHVGFMDSRLVISSSYNIRGNYNIYTISAPDYSGGTTGLNYTLNRIQWPDAAPGDTNVNSTIFSLKNINNRDVKTITWHIEDLGEITANSNFEMWTNMSGSWASIGVCDASGNITTLDISGEVAGGGEWEPGGTFWWKLEILAVGSVNEDIHVCDESIYYRITFT